MTRPGRRGARVELWRDTGTGQSPLGAAVPAWGILGSRYVQIDSRSGSESFSDGSERARQPVRFFMPFDEDTRTLGPKDRIKWDDTVQSLEYDIQSVSILAAGSVHPSVEVSALLRSPEADRLP